MDHKLKTEYYCCKHKVSAGGAYILARPSVPDL